ncbi:tRNA-modifying protein YgfZ [Thalassotalea sp. PLHSN55]|uniref:tRNA-modifying protein YgfZ n=1 Tax=Thalassotalea sp. PLHSN55 TaxID=3435888 RepID=UPI003F84FE21
MTLITQQSLPAFNQLPQTYAIALEQFSAISLSGEDKTSYLQGQVTCDVTALNEQQLAHGAHCNAKGKVFSVFRLINRDDSHLLMQHQASLDASLAELQKFGVFSKVTIEKTSQLSFAALAGTNASEYLLKTFNITPDNLSPVVQADSTTLVYIAGQTPRYLLIDSAEKINQHLTSFALPVYPQQVWQLLEITEGFPNLSSPSIDEYVPQMLNVHAIHGISFNKGCYLGQETVARMQYLGKNKRALFALTGAGDVAPEAGGNIEIQLGENWRKGGDIIQSYQADSGEIYLQAVLANDVDTQSNLRVKGNESVTLQLIELPYSL